MKKNLRCYEEDYQFLEEVYQGLREEHFQIYFQPIINVETNTLYGAEALLRWDHPEKGMIAPDVFIPKLESTGLITKIGDWVLFRVIRQLAHWNLAGYTFHISINVSLLQLLQEQFYEKLQHYLTLYQIQEGTFVIELTETLPYDDLTKLEVMVKNIKALGVRFALDDFGTGYAAIEKIAYLEPDIVKLDRFFLQKMSDRRQLKIILETVIRLSNQLKMKTVIEGVETLEDYTLIQRLGGDFVQGYYFAEPLPVARFQKEWLHTR